MIFLESPVPILVCGIVVEAALAVALLRTGRGVLLWWMGGVAIVVLLGVLVERLVVTDRKRVAQTIDGAAAAVEANDLPRLLEYVDPSATQVRAEAARTHGTVRVEQVNVRNLEVTFNRLTNPPTAKATFDAYVSGKSLSGEGSVPVRVTLGLCWQKDRWLVTEYSYQFQGMGR
jgi:hypothetical protein